MGPEHGALSRTWCVQISAFCVSVCTSHLNAERAILGHTHCTGHHRMRARVHPEAGSDSLWPSAVGQPHWRCVCGTYWFHCWQFQKRTLEPRSLNSQKWSDCRSRSKRPFGLLKWLPKLLVLPCLLATCSAKKEERGHRKHQHKVGESRPQSNVLVILSTVHHYTYKHELVNPHNTPAR